MKIGCCVNMLGNAGDPIGEQYLSVLKELGYDYVELPLAQVMDLSENDFDAFLERVVASGIPCEACNNFFPQGIRLTGNDVSWPEVEAYVERAVDRAERLGAKVIVFGSSGAKNVPPDYDHALAFQQIVKALRIADKYVGPKGIRVAIEPLNHRESNIILNLTEARRLMEVVDRPSIRLLVDYYHHRIEGESPDILDEALPSIVHAHFADPEKRQIPLSMTAEFMDFFEKLSQSYDGRISLEAYAQEHENELNRFIQMMSQVR